MAELLRIQEPSRPRAATLSWRALSSAFLEMAFRPLYLCGALWAALAIALWVFAPAWLSGELHGLAWHAHEMLWGFVATIAVGFLMTAGANWTGINPLRGRPLGLVCALWALARLAFLVPGKSAFVTAAAAEFAFFAIAGIAMLAAVHKSRNRRNYGVPWLLIALGAIDLLYLQAARGGDYPLLMQRFDAGLLCMAVLALLVARRVIPFFAMRAVPGLVIPMHTRSGHWQLGFSALAVLLTLFNAQPWTAPALGAAGAIALLQLLAWRPWRVRGKPLLWILYLGYALLGLGLLAAAAHDAGLALRAAWPVHIIAVGGFSVLIIGMITRTALGHLGRALQLDRSMLASYWLMLVACALRLAALLSTALAASLLQAAALCWIAALSLYLWRFAPLMIRPRPDAKSSLAAMPVKVAVR
ncbi:MAG TPA: NnrS family protein [Methylibium sp.]